MTIAAATETMMVAILSLFFMRPEFSLSDRQYTVSCYNYKTELTTGFEPAHDTLQGCNPPLGDASMTFTFAEESDLVLGLFVASCDRYTCLMGYWSELTVGIGPT